MKTVRITYFLAMTLHRVDIMAGDEVCDHITVTGNEDLAEGYARGVARILGVDIERVDMP